jgi:hypothetical protein
MDAASPPNIVVETEAQPPPAAAGADQPMAHEAPPSLAPLPPPPPPIAAPPMARYEAPALAARPEYEMPTLEIGMGTFFMVGAAAGGYAGVSPFLVDEVAEGVFLRPSIGVGGSLGATSSIWLAARLDACARLPGRYASRNGIQLDLCGGAGGGFSSVASGTQRGAPPAAVTLPYVDLGPSASLRGEVGDLAISLRTVAGIDVAHAGFVDVTGAKEDAPLLSWRLEVDFSWALQRAR